MISNLTAATPSPQQAQLGSVTQNLAGVIKKQGATTGTRKHDMISGFPVTSPYGPRWGTMHKGIDIGTPEGTYVALDVDVEIMYSGLHGSRPGHGYGNVVDAWAPSLKLQFRLAHLNKRLCSTGQKIPAGVPLGRTGGAAGDIGRGSSDGPHLHFEVDRNKNGTVYGGSGDPSPYVGHLILSSTKPTGQAPNQTATLVPGGGQQQRQVAGVQNYASYERGGGGGVSMVPIPGQTPSAGGGGGGMSVVGGSTKDLVNSYYKSQLMGFLYKQG
jgi:murein DD-endopeptidase MepM/ murein hydrolase activator NlpD